MRLPRPALLVALICVVAASSTAAQNPPSTGPAVGAVLRQYCFACHNERAQIGGLALDSLDMTQVAERPDVWEEVVRKLRTGAMPPAGRPRPAAAEADTVATWLETELDRAAAEQPNPGRPTLHRLNRAEYRNAVRDLFALDVDASLLPADNAAYGFDNNADALTLSSALTERYLGAAAKISQMALGRLRGSPPPETILVPTDRDQGARLSDDLPFGSRGGTAFRYYFPVDGDYRFEMRPQEGGVDGGFMGITSEPHRLDVRVDGRRDRHGRGAKSGWPARRGPHRGHFGQPAVHGARSGRVVSGAGVLRRQDLGLRRRSVRSELAPGSLPRGERRTGRLQCHDYRSPRRKRVRQRLAQPPSAARV